MRIGKIYALWCQRTHLSIQRIRRFFVRGHRTMNNCEVSIILRRVTKKIVRLFIENEGKESRRVAKHDGHHVRIDLNK